MLSSDFFFKINFFEKILLGTLSVLNGLITMSISHILLLIMSFLFVCFILSTIVVCL